MGSLRRDTPPHSPPLAAFSPLYEVHETFRSVVLGHVDVSRFSWACDLGPYICLSVLTIG
jgi:hypothetical protein